MNCEKTAIECQSLIGKVQQQYLCCLFIIISLFSLIFNHFSQKILLAYKAIFPRSLIFSHFQGALAFEEVDRLF